MGNTTVCDSKRYPIVLANLITGEQGRNLVTNKWNRRNFLTLRQEHLFQPGTSLTTTFQYNVTGILPALMMLV
jgi:hypothetical protein